MFDNRNMMPPRIVKEIVPAYHTLIDHCRQLADNDANMAAVLPGKPSTTGKPRLFTPLKAALMAIMADFINVGVKAPLAAKIARRIMDAHLAQPASEQWSIVVTQNGNVSTMPYDQTELRTGFISGSRLAFALCVDLRTYADRVNAAVADLPIVIGGDDE